MTGNHYYPKMDILIALYRSTAGEPMQISPADDIFAKDNANK